MKRRRDWRRISEREVREWAGAGSEPTGERGELPLYGRCSRCGRAFEFKPRYGPGEEPVYDAERGLWFCGWECFERHRG